MGLARNIPAPSLSDGVQRPADEPVPAAVPAEPVTPTSAPDAPARPSWQEFARKASPVQIRDRVAEELRELCTRHEGVTSAYSVVALLEVEDSIDAYDLDKIYAALQKHNGSRSRDVLLMLLSRGGRIEPAYQIAKLCKAYSKTRFVVAVPRIAKSAATLIALGADEVHMGELGQLGPIDPQLDGLPALGVQQALETIASLCEKHAGSAEMFARYLRMAVSVEQIGYCDRVVESAAQYAERLLSTKAGLPKSASEIAKHLVYTYKDHGFVIDLEEARRWLGSDWVKTGTPELQFAEAVYSLLDFSNLVLGMRASKRVLVVGSLGEPQDIIVFDTRNR